MITDKLKTVQPIKDKEFETIVIQEVIIFDPRDIIGSCMPIEKGDTVQIQRVIRRVPKGQLGLDFHLLPTKLIEIIKEYTFEEWDSALKEEI